MSKYGVFSGPYFPVFGLNTEIYGVNGPNVGKYGPEKTPYLDTFHTVTGTYNEYIEQIEGKWKDVLLISCSHNIKLSEGGECRGNWEGNF